MPGLAQTSLELCCGLVVLLVVTCRFCKDSMSPSPFCTMTAQQDQAPQLVFTPHIFTAMPSSVLQNSSLSPGAVQRDTQ